MRIVLFIQNCKTPNSIYSMLINFCLNLKLCWKLRKHGKTLENEPDERFIPRNEFDPLTKTLRHKLIHVVECCSLMFVYLFLEMLCIHVRHPSLSNTEMPCTLWNWGGMENAHTHRHTSHAMHRVRERNKASACEIEIRFYLLSLKVFECIVHKNVWLTPIYYRFKTNIIHDKWLAHSNTNSDFECDKNSNLFYLFFHAHFSLPFRHTHIYV